MIVNNAPQYQIEASGLQPALFHAPEANRKHLLDFDACGVEPSLVYILLEIRSFSAKFNNKLKYNTAGDALSVLVQICSFLHRLLHPLGEIRSKLEPDYISESCRFAAALYIFIPLRSHFPDPTLMINSLIHKLKNSLSMLVTSITMEKQLLIWLLYVGGVLAAGIPEREWFVGYLVVLVQDLSICSWQAMAVVLRKVIWQDVFCQAPGHLLWHEICLRKENLGIL